MKSSVLTISLVSELILLHSLSNDDSENCDNVFLNWEFTSYL